jgi:hypothetical protein
MSAPTLNDRALAELLPGRWEILATNFPVWLLSAHINPSVEYEVVREDPLVLASVIRFETEDGEEKTIHGRSRWTGEDFVRRGRGFRRLVKSRWSVGGVSDAGHVVTIRTEKSMMFPEGVTLIVRDDVDTELLRAHVANNSTRFGLTAEDFASLGWM